MPIWDYTCDWCGEVFEKLNGETTERCESCGEYTKRNRVQLPGYRRDHTIHQGE